MIKLGINIDGTYIKSVLVKDHHIYEKKQDLTPLTFEEFVVLLRQVIQDYLQNTTQHGLSKKSSAKRTVILFYSSSVSYLDKLTLKELIQHSFPIDSVIENGDHLVVFKEVIQKELKGVISGVTLKLNSAKDVDIYLHGKSI